MLVAAAALAMLALAPPPPAVPANQNPILARASHFDARLTGIGRRFKGNAASQVFGFNRRRAIAEGGEDYNAAGLADFSQPMAAYLAQPVINGLREIHAGYIPTTGSAYSLFTLGHELGHIANKQHINERLADRYAVSAWSRLASAFGITNPKKQLRMLALARAAMPDGYK